MQEPLEPRNRHAIEGTSLVPSISFNLLPASLRSSSFRRPPRRCYIVRSTVLAATASMTRKLPTLGNPKPSTPASSANPVSDAPTISAASPPSTVSSSRKTFVVTGANRGIGLELARQLSRHGHVIATAREPCTAQTLRSLPHVTVIALDISSASSIASAAKEITRLAPHGVDELWNNAAQNSVKFLVDEVEEEDVDKWVQQLRVNVAGATMVTRALLPVLKDGKGKKVVFIGSTAGSVTRATGNGQGVAYSTSKAALHMSIKFWHHQLVGEGFVVTPIHPGWVKTDMGGGGADIDVEESVDGMLKVIGGLKASDDLKLRVYDGTVLPW